MRSLAPWRIRTISLLLLVPVALIVGRLYMVQIENGKSYAERAERQYVRPSTKVFDRGNIYFATKDGSNYSAAVLKSGFLLVANATKIKDVEATYTALNKLHPLDKAEYTAHIKKNDTYEELAKHIDEEVGKKIQALALQGITLVREKWRVYPGEQLASHTLGFVGFKGDELVGRYGLERFYENILQRQSSSLYVNFFAEIFSNASNAVSDDKPAEGDIVSWIEPSVQTYLEQQIDEVHKDWKTDLTAGIVMDPKTGAILAMAATPDFDPNTYNTEKDISRFSNPLVENIYEMGSIIKPLTMAAGIDAGAVTASTTYNDKGSLTLDGFTIYNFDKKARGIQSMQDVLNHSLNTGVDYVVSTMGKDTFAEYMRSYGISELTGIDLPNEVRGRADNLSSPRDVEYATAAFGQGISMTPIATARALAVLANGGVLVQPQVVKRIEYRLGLAKDKEPIIGKRVIRAETSKEITRMLVTVVDKALRDGKVKLDRYSVAAKTGTAQMPKIGGNGYYTDRYLHSFFGYFPAYNPRFLVFLYSVYPKGANYASETLTTPFINITKYLLNFYTIPPDR